MAVKDMTGQKIGRFSVTAYAGSERGVARWHCRCDCGAERVVPGAWLREGKTRSCGCLKIDTHRVHNMSHTPTHRAWMNMMARCQNPRTKQYPNYGGRGITVCGAWQTFAAFLADMGVKPDGLTLERNDVNGNYEPSNCRWATMRDQFANKRNTRAIAYLGRTLTMSEWSRELGIPLATVKARLDKGRPLAEVFSPSSRRSPLPKAV